MGCLLFVTKDGELGTAEELEASGPPLHRL